MSAATEIIKKGVLNVRLVIHSFTHAEIIYHVEINTPPKLYNQ